MKETNMNTLKQVPPEQMGVYDDGELLLEGLLEQVVITGNRDFKDYGDKKLIDIINGDYYDDDCAYDYETFEELQKVTGKRWERRTMHGYGQSDWQYLYFAVDETNGESLDAIEDFYMGKVTEFTDEDCCSYYVPDDVVWKGKQAICDYLGLPVDETTILKPTNRHVVYDYEQLQ